MRLPPSILCSLVRFCATLLFQLIPQWLRHNVSGNHTGYGQFKGTRASADEIRDIYEGLKQSNLTDFDVMLSGYAPSAEAVEAIGSIARDLRFKSSMKPGSFFWGAFWPRDTRRIVIDR